MEALKPVPAIVGAKLMEQWRFLCSSIGFYYNYPHKSRYIAISWEPRLRPVAALSILFGLLLMEALRPVPAIVGAKLIEQWRFLCSSIGLYYE
jgi:hypothetical protein